MFELFAAAPLVKRKFEDQDNIPAAADNAANNAAADAAPTPASAADPPATPPDRGASGEEGLSGPQPCWQGRQGGEANRGW